MAKASAVAPPPSMSRGDLAQLKTATAKQTPDGYTLEYAHAWAMGGVVTAAPRSFARGRQQLQLSPD
ncbi:MAG: hypothetical protein Q8S42_19645 [Archangium sp.]|nr:hypothetical protein [Archangium sp.]